MFQVHFRTANVKVNTFVISQVNAFYYDLFNSLRKRHQHLNTMMNDEFEDFTHHQQVAPDLRRKNATYSKENFYFEPLSSSTPKINKQQQQQQRNLNKKDELENKFRLHSNTEWKEYGMVSIKGFLKHGHGETTAFCHMPIAQQLIMSNFALSTVMLLDPVCNTTAQNLVQLIFKVKCLVNGLNLGFWESPYYGFTILNHFAPYKAHHSLPVSSGLSLLFPTATGVNNEFNTAGETIFIVR